MTKIYPLNVGLKIILDTNQPITNATKMEIHVMRPDGVERTWAATALDVAPASEWSNMTAAEQEAKRLRCITYTTASTDFDKVGNYYLMAYVEWGVNSKHHGESVKIVISNNYT